MLTREVPFELRDSEDSDGNTLYGYASVYNQSTRIDSWEGLFDEEFAPGAFDASLAERTPVLQFDHGKHPLIGSLPLGYFRSITSDDYGLLVDAPLHDNWLVQPVRDAIKSGAIPGMSIRFVAQEEVWTTAGGEVIGRADVERALMRATRSDEASIPKRRITRAALYEQGPVVFPAYAQTTVGVRSRELADLLTDPQVRAEAARILVGTPAESSEPEGGSDEGREAPNTPDEKRRVPSPEARDRGLRLEKEVGHRG